MRDHSSVPRNMARAPVPPSLAARDRPKTARQASSTALERREGGLALAGLGLLDAFDGWVGSGTSQKSTLTQGLLCQESYDVPRHATERMTSIPRQTSGSGQRTQSCIMHQTVIRHCYLTLDLESANRVARKARTSAITCRRSGCGDGHLGRALRRASRHEETHPLPPRMRTSRCVALRDEVRDLIRATFASAPSARLVG